MSKPTDIQIVDAVVRFESVPFRTPLKFGGRLVEKSVLVNVDVTAETRKGHPVTGTGSMPLGNVWAWPSETLSSDQTEAVMKRFAEEVVNIASAFNEFGHPIDTAYQLSGEYFHLGKTLS